jgi:hypothetical protein
MAVSPDRLTKLLTEIRSRWPVARGSLCEVARPCVRPNCSACARGQKHPGFIFSYRGRDGRQRCLYVPRDLVAALKRALASGKWLEQRLVEVGEAMVFEHRRKRDQRAGAERPRTRRRPRPQRRS